MRDARSKFFRSDMTPDREVVAKVERALERLLAGGAPEGVEIEDIEEEWDPVGRVWVPVTSKNKKKRAAVKRVPGPRAGKPEAEEEGMAEVDLAVNSSESDSDDDLG